MFKALHKWLRSQQWQVSHCISCSPTVGGEQCDVPRQPCLDWPQEGGVGSPAAPLLRAVRRACSELTALGFREQTLLSSRTFLVESHGIEPWRAEGTKNEAGFKGYQPKAQEWHNPGYSYRCVGEVVESSPEEINLVGDSRWKTTWAGSECLQPRKPKVSWAVSKGLWPAVQGRGFSPLYSALERAGQGLFIKAVVTGQGVLDKNQKRRNFGYWLEISSLLWRWWGPGKGCPGSLYIPHPWNCSQPGWTGLEQPDRERSSNPWQGCQN